MIIGNTVAIRSFTVLLPYCYRIAREEEGRSHFLYCLHISLWDSILRLFLFAHWKNYREIISSLWSLMLGRSSKPGIEHFSALNLESGCFGKHLCQEECCVNPPKTLCPYHLGMDKEKLTAVALNIIDGFVNFHSDAIIGDFALMS